LNELRFADSCRRRGQISNAKDETTSYRKKSGHKSDPELPERPDDGLVHRPFPEHFDCGGAARQLRIVRGLRRRLPARLKVCDGSRKTSIIEKVGRSDPAAKGCSKAVGRSKNRGEVLRLGREDTPTKNQN
jgi:hypothetical protein